MPNNSANMKNFEPAFEELFNDPITLMAVKSSGFPKEQVLKIYEDTRREITLLRASSLVE